jgi:hypothetical protein
MYIKINSRILFGPVNSNFYFEDWTQWINKDNKTNNDLQEEFEDTKGVIRIRISKKNIHFNETQLDQHTV